MFYKPLDLHNMSHFWNQDHFTYNISSSLLPWLPGNTFSEIST